MKSPVSRQGYSSVSYFLMNSILSVFLGLWFRTQCGILQVVKLKEYLTFFTPKQVQINSEINKFGNAR